MKLILIILLWVAIIFTAIAYIMFLLVFGRNYGLPESSGDDNGYAMSPTGSLRTEFMKPRKEYLRGISCVNETVESFDGLKLVGHFYKGTDESVTVICVHGYRGNYIDEFAGISEIFFKRGYNILMTDDRAHGESEGKYIGYGVLDRYDVVTWADFIAGKYPDTKIILAGCSMGAATVLFASDDKNLPKNVKGIISDSGYDSVAEVMETMLKPVFHIPKFPLLYLAGMWAYLLAHISIFKDKSSEHVKNAVAPICIIVGTEDKFVPKEVALRIYDACKTPKKLLLCENTGHVASYVTHTGEYIDTVNEFIDTIALK